MNRTVGAVECLFVPCAKMGAMDAEKRKKRGFTLVELMIVLAIISLLLGIALPNYRVSVRKAREAVLAENLYQIRDCLEKFRLDKGQYPVDLEELVGAGYLKKVPVDPMTGQANWERVLPDPGLDLPEEEDASGIVDVHSGSNDMALDGTAYASW